jgi:hypothetical protein
VGAPLAALSANSSGVTSAIGRFAAVEHRKDDEGRCATASPAKKEALVAHLHVPWRIKKEPPQ